MSIPRALLAQAFANNPRLRAEMESAFNLVDTLRDRASSLEAQLNIVASQIGADTFQPESNLLTALSGLSGRFGVVELLGIDQIQARPVDTPDAASLISRANGMGFFGKGPSTSRPTPPSGTQGVYFDTTLAANGKPIYWTGTAWVDSTGAAV